MLRLKNSKGVSGFALYGILGLFVTSLIIGALTGTYPETLNFFKDEMTDLQDDRIVNAAYALTSQPRGYVELEITGYDVSVNYDEISVRYAETTSTIDLDDTPLKDHYSDISGPSFETIDGKLCLKKPSDDELEVTKGEC